MNGQEYNQALASLEIMAKDEISNKLKKKSECHHFKNDELVIAGIMKYSDVTEDIVLTKVISEDNKIRFYGRPAHCVAEEGVVDYIEPAYYGYIIDGI